MKNVHRDGLSYPSSPMFVDFYGQLDGLGTASAVLDTNGPLPGGVGFTISLAYALKGTPWNFAASPILLKLRA